MLVILVVLVIASALSSLPQPPWCPIPTGPYKPPDCGPNAKFDLCPRRYLPIFCSALWARQYRPPSTCCEPDCVCDNGFLRSDVSGECVSIPECFKVCDKNEHYVVNSPICRRSCASRFETCRYCNRKPLTGCVCNRGYVRLFDDDTGPCIPENSCPQCGPNEEITDCEVSCPSQSCEDMSKTYNCKRQICKIGCRCIANYLKNKLGMCIPKKHCPVSTYNYLCSPTCAVPNPRDCFIVNEECPKGYILSEYGGKCIKIEDCPPDLGCNGDPNAVTKEYPLPCPSTCDAPNAAPCYKAIDHVGCECLPGYIINNDDGMCIEPEECPGGYPCRQNETFVPCRVWCRSNYCPWTDFLRPATCLTPTPCYSGCDCSFSFKRKSRDDDRCIFGEECPKLECTRQNEEWDSCPPNDLREYCGDSDYPSGFYENFAITCNSRCVCKQNYLRNSSHICIPAKECPDNN